MRAIVKYQIVTYQGEIEILCDPDDDNDVTITKTKR
jgi:hypothetical protein